MSLKNEMPNLFRKGHPIHRRIPFALKPVRERVYFIRYGERSATHKNSPFSGKISEVFS